MKEELLDEWLCDKCKEDTKHKLNVILQKLPEIVLIRVKISNNFNNVKFKEKLKINSINFEWIGVVHHQGVSYGLLFYFVFIFIQIWNYFEDSYRYGDNGSSYGSNYGSSYGSYYGSSYGGYGYSSYNTANNYGSGHCIEYI